MSAKRMLVVVAAVFWASDAACPAGLAAAKSPAPKVVFSEGFEGEGKMRPWASNGPYQVNFAGPSEDRAASGRRSFKIDVTWTDCTYNYWWSAPLMVPYHGKPKVSGKLYVERGGAVLGFANVHPEAGTGGNVSHGERVGKLPGGWIEWAATAEAPAGSSQYVQAVAVYLRPDKQGRSVVYVDDLAVEAALPGDYQAKLQARIAQITARRRAAMREEGEALRARLARIAADIDREPAALPAGASPALVECWTKRGEFCRASRAELEVRLQRLQSAPRNSDLAAARRLVLSLEKAHASAGSFLKYAETNAKLPYVVWIVDPISDRRVLPGEFPVFARLGTDLRVTACRGEYEPASFAVYAPKGVRRLVAEPTVSWEQVKAQLGL